MASAATFLRVAQLLIFYPLSYRFKSWFGLKSSLISTLGLFFPGKFHKNRGIDITVKGNGQTDLHIYNISVDCVQ